MNRTEEEIMQLYNQNEKLIHATIYRQFSNPSYIVAHGLTSDDLRQYGRLGLYKACQSYDESKGAAFQNHAIRCIIGTILKESKVDSLSNVNNKSNTLIDRTSLDIVHTNENDEETTLLDALESEESGFRELEIEEFIDSIEMSLSENVANIVRMRLEGYTFEEIGVKTDVSRQAVEQMLKRSREKIVELYECV